MARQRLQKSGALWHLRQKPQVTVIIVTITSFCVTTTPKYSPYHVHDLYQSQAEVDYHVLADVEHRPNAGVVTAGKDNRN